MSIDKPNGASDSEMPGGPPPSPPLGIEERVAALEARLQEIVNILKPEVSGANSLTNISGRLSGVSGQVDSLDQDVQLQKDKFRIKLNLLSQRVETTEDRLDSIEPVVALLK